ncbi:MAG: GntR family transcriptional regulator [Chloroflexi bacterium]|nr:GntR family transcriptional regulator [Chloroflexota bacterium]
MVIFAIQRDSSLPLHMQLLDELRHKVMTGVLKPHERLPGEWELANELDISRATVQKAWHSAEEEGLLYRVPGKGTFVAEPRSAASARSTVGMLVPDFRGTFAVHLLSGVERVLRKQGYSVHLAATEYRIDEEDRLLRQMQLDRMSGCIVWAMRPSTNDRLLATIGEEMPVVLIDRPVPGVALPCVTSNNYQGGRQAMQHLIDLGHRDVAFLARPHLDLWSVGERYRAYQDALRDAGLPSRPAILLGDENELSSYDAYIAADEAALAPLVDLLRQTDRPTAIFAVNDWMAMRALRAAHMAGVRVPEDISLVGFDNLDVSEYLMPPLTTIAQNTELMGSEAARRLLTMIEGEEIDDTLTLLPTKLVVRRSTARLRNTT